MVEMRAGPVTRDYSKTSVQVEEVDEAGIIRTGGTYLHVVTGSCMHILRAYPATDANFCRVPLSAPLIVAPHRMMPNLPR
jgi:uncharacterized secreted protein with C-terminal beta-propeller domain